MSAPRCYLDYNATTPLRPGARAAVVAALELTGNPSSVHGEGREARRLVEQARRQVGDLVGAAADRVVFTSGATEAANATLSPDLSGPTAPRGTRRLLLGATEHAAVRLGHRFAQTAVADLPVDRDGTVRLDALASALLAEGGSPALVALQGANNETGVLQPLREAADLVHRAGGLLVCDAVQVVGRLPFDMNSSGADAVLLSSHKLGGPQGVGAIAFGTGVAPGPAVLRGGGQERGFRSGTENVAGIAGFGAAAMEARRVPDTARLTMLRDALERGIRQIAEDGVVFGAGAPRLPNTACFAVPGTAAETLLIALDLAGVAVSSGSACSSGKVGASPALGAMARGGLDVDPALGFMRVSLGDATSEAEVDAFAVSFAKLVQRAQAAARSLAAA